MIRSIAGQTKDIYLTFDDGPDEEGTLRVLDVLERKGAKATFFLIGEKLSGRGLSLAREIKSAGHAIGSHSWDHKYRNYFRGRASTREWILKGEREIEAAGLGPSLGFRPPAGVITPQVLRAVRELNRPLILWNERFYDAVFKWTPQRAARSAERLKPGSIVLLHDRQSPSRVLEFCSTLSEYIDRLQNRGLECRRLTEELCRQS